MIRPIARYCSAAVCFLLTICQGADARQPVQGRKPPVKPAESVLLAARLADEQRPHEVVGICYKLAGIADTAAVDALFMQFQSPRLPNHKVATLCLGYMGQSRVVSRVVPYLRSKEAGQRCNAAWIIGRGGALIPEAEAALIRLLADENWQVRMYAAWALGRHRSKNGVPALRRLRKKERGRKDGTEAGIALKRILEPVPEFRTAGRAPWLIVPGMDAPSRSLNVASILKIRKRKQADAFFLGKFAFVTDDEDRPLRIAIPIDIPYAIVYYSGSGWIKDIWTRREVPVYSPDAPEDD